MANKKIRIQQNNGAGYDVFYPETVGSVVKMADYAKPASTGAIVVTDTANSAIGKVEKALDSKVNTSDITTTLGTSAVKVPSEKAVSDAMVGAGYGDMLKTTYDTTNKETDIFDYADTKIAASLATDADQALVSTGVGAWAVKTLAQFKTWLGLKAAAFLDLDVEGGVASHNALETHTAEKSSQSALGHVKVDGSTIIADVNGVISSIASGVPDVILRDILRIKMRQTGLNLDPNAWSDSVEDISGVNTGLSGGYYFDNVNKSIKWGDQDIITQTTTSGGNVVYASAWRAQTFTAVSELNGKTNIRVKLKSAGKMGTGSNISVTIRKFTTTIAGIISNAVTFTPSTWPEGSSYAVCDFTLTEALVNGQVYAIVITASDGNETSGNSWAVNATSLYSGGQGYASTDGGTSWVGSAITEYGFVVQYVADSATVVWNAVTSDGMLSSGIVESIESLGTGTITYYLSRDNGTTFTACTLDTITNISVQPSGDDIVLKVIITGNAELFAVAWGGVA